jgi:hypothetical protein
MCYKPARRTARALQGFGRSRVAMRFVIGTVIVVAVITAVLLLTR